MPGAGIGSPGLAAANASYSEIKMKRWAWERLTVHMLRNGWAYLYMKHFLATEFDKICKDPVLAAKCGIEIFPTPNRQR